MAVGDTLISWEATAYTPAPTNYPTPDIRNNHPVLDFDASIAETAYFEGKMPSHYSGGSIQIRLVWMATTGTTGTVFWSVQFERHDPATNLGGDSFSATVADWNVGGAPGTSGLPVSQVWTVTRAMADGITAGDHFRISVTRAAADPTYDTMPGDAELMSIELREA